MSVWFARALALALFGLLATANSGGYRYGASDQAFYVPAPALIMNPSLFPRDRVVLAPQMRLWLGDSVLGQLGRLFRGDLPALYASLYFLTLLGLFLAGMTLARSLGASWMTVGAFLILLTLRHQITKTGANSLEGYMHPRTLAFACGLAALACVVRTRVGVALVWIAATAVMHTTTGLWFAGVVGVAAVWRWPQRNALLLTALGASLLAVAAVMAGVFARSLPVMDEAWFQVLGEKDYLFSADWPFYAWALNLAYPVVLVILYRRRLAVGSAVTGEAGLIAGLIALVAIFLLSVPLTEQRLALAVQLQVNRIFWILDAVAAFYLSWWLVADLGRHWSGNARRVLVGLLLVASALRGYYVVHVATARPLIELHLPTGDWTDAMNWLRTQPASWHVLANPQHAWRFGSSVRVAAYRDTLLEIGKDSALAIYDRDVALRVAERGRALARFDEFTAADIRTLAATYNLDVFVDEITRGFEFPILYRNDRFVIYDLR